jgi:hypothetical protein
MRSEVTSRSNRANDSSTLRVSHPMEVVVLPPEKPPSSYWEWIRVPPAWAWLQM